jgi:hypothetical protein
MRLIEICVIGVHQIATRLYQFGESPHDKSQLDLWEPKFPPRETPRFSGIWSIKKQVKLHPALLSHSEYIVYRQYPYGLSDVVGYWAEQRILGGVILFGRGTSGFEVS